MQKLLMPTDGSPCSEQAIEKGLECAEKLGAEVTFVYVLENPMAALWVTPEAVPYAFELIEDLKKAAKEALERARKMAEARGVKAETKLVEDENPVQAIVSLSPDYDMIVMGTHGRSGLDRILLGSVTEGVLRRVETPVLVVRCKPK